MISSVILSPLFSTDTFEYLFEYNNLSTRVGGTSLLGGQSGRRYEAERAGAVKNDAGYHVSATSNMVSAHRTTDRTSIIHRPQYDQAAIPKSLPATGYYLSTALGLMW